MAKVTVTPDDISKGLPGNVECCPVALALKRALPNRHVVVRKVSLLIEGEYYYTPQMVENFIAVFDAGRRVGLPEVEFDTDELQLVYADEEEEE